jgi:REP element-mobilizing transposase RayT
MNDYPLGYLITWTTYGTWLPGDSRWWTEKQAGHQPPNDALERHARALLGEHPCRLGPDQRRLVEKSLKDYCARHGWVLHAVNCRSNHCHVVVTANLPSKQVRTRLKAHCTMKLRRDQRRRQIEPIRENWWTERGSRRNLWTDENLEAAIRYVLEAQDNYVPPPRRLDDRPRRSNRSADGS